ncbi:MAG TPA: 3-hydroxyacyl-CoA dehydrogenase family protein [Bacteroidales bacterium]|nr:3-hydroxyacyl-CoA dehydrogenase family protein [Bacteroidales bacterium]HPI86031.1 3-hydroxyacyl-CoA dehydrogenase family protein [Bacteroidales bacterium]
MDYTNKLQNVTVLGAAGKMGSGILLLTAVEMADLSLKPENKGKAFVLNAMDVSKEGLHGLMLYLRAQVQKIAEKKTVALRKIYADRADLVENEEIINQYIFDVMNIVRPTTRLESAYDSTLVFEAVSENRALKVKILNQIDQNNPEKPWFFTNTSSVPIHLIDEEAGLGGRILGFHFYNPPAVQKLVELIVTSQTDAEMTEFAKVYAKNLGKIVVPANDFAGFIGNGHFMRDALHGIQTAQKLTKELTFVEAVYAVNRITQDFLIRPMGIFQLIDYVGIDVVSFIMGVMNPFLPDEDLHSSLLDKMLELGVKGGQYSDGSQKDGFLKYEKGKPVAIYDPQAKAYVPVSSMKEKIDKYLGEAPSSLIPWKAAVKVKDKDATFGKIFADMKMMNSNGAKLAVEYGQRSDAIGKKLVADNVAFNENDVNTVLLTGFFHAYGPVNGYF